LSKVKENVAPGGIWWSNAPPSAVTVCAMSCLLVQVTCWPVLTFRVAGENAKLSMVTAVPLAGVPASPVVGPLPELLLPPPQPTTSAPAAASRVSAALCGA
jgi:hypothetical protein